LELPDFVRAGNQAGHPSAYEIETAAIDHERTLAEALAATATWEQRDLLDLGCGIGY
jgi:predicted RNA methylase